VNKNPNESPARCATCIFRVDGECHRSPPIPMLIGFAVKSVWPEVEANHACGEYESEGTRLDGRTHE